MSTDTSHRFGDLDPTDMERLTPQLQRLVHRSVPGHVLPSAMRALGDGTFEVDICLQQHPFASWTPEDGFDAFLFIEAARQSGLLVGHAGLGIDQDSQFALTLMQVDVRLACAMDSLPPACRLTVTCAEVVSRGQAVSVVRYRMELVLDGQVIGRARIDATILPASTYGRLRYGALRSNDVEMRSGSPAAEAASTGRRHSDVLITAGTKDCRLRIDPKHPVFFDHLTDHVPGILLIEAARQAVQMKSARALALVELVEARFWSYVELDGASKVRVVEQREVGREVHAVVTIGPAGSVACRLSLVLLADPLAPMRPRS